jgi:hypothetical protein
MLFERVSIQPKQSAWSTASDQLIARFPVWVL